MDKDDIFCWIESFFTGTNLQRGMKSVLLYKIIEKCEESGIGEFNSEYKTIDGEKFQFTVKLENMDRKPAIDQMKKADGGDGNGNKKI